jgi:hypothetical protein
VRTAIYLTPEELELVRGMAVTHSQRLGGDLRTRRDLTPEGRDRYAAQLDTALGLLRALRQAMEPAHA